MVHNRECPKCGMLGRWNWAKKRELKTMPNGETVRVKVIKKGQPAVVCSSCKHKFEPHSHAKLNEAWKKVERGLKNGTS